MGDVVQFRDPNAELTGAELEAALAACREWMPALVTLHISNAFAAISKLPGCSRLGVEASLPIFCEAIRAELAKVEGAYNG